MCKPRFCQVLVTWSKLVLRETGPAVLNPKQLWPTADGALSFEMLVGHAVAVLTRAL